MFKLAQFHLHICGVVPCVCNLYPEFRLGDNLSTLIGQAAILMVLSSAMSLAIITGELTCRWAVWSH